MFIVTLAFLSIPLVLLLTVFIETLWVWIISVHPKTCIQVSSSAKTPGANIAGSADPLVNGPHIKRQNTAPPDQLRTGMRSIRPSLRTAQCWHKDLCYPQPHCSINNLLINLADSQTDIRTQNGIPTAQSRVQSLWSPSTRTWVHHFQD